MSRIKNITAALALGLALAGCSTAQEAPQAKPTASTKAPAPAPSPAKSQPSDSPSEEAAPGTKPFGQTWTYDDGLSITVSKPKPYKPSGIAAIDNPALDKTFVVMTVTIKNGSSAVYDSALFTIQAMSGERQVNRVFDNGIDFQGAPLLPGKTVKFKVVYPSDKGKEFIVFVTGDFDIHSAQGAYQG